jgi:hypothetical protein
MSLLESNVVEDIPRKPVSTRWPLGYLEAIDRLIGQWRLMPPGARPITEPNRSRIIRRAVLDYLRRYGIVVEDVEEHSNTEEEP